MGDLLATNRPPGPRWDPFGRTMNRLKLPDPNYLVKVAEVVAVFGALEAGIFLTNSLSGWSF